MRTFFPLLQPRHKLLPPVNVNIVGVQSAINANGLSGIPIITVTGTRTSITCAAQLGNSISTITGVQCNINAASQVGSIQTTITAQANTTSTGSAGVPQLIVDGLVTEVDSSGSPGIPESFTTVIGVSSTTPVECLSGIPRILITAQATVTVTAGVGFVVHNVKFKVRLGQSNWFVFVGNRYWIVRTAGSNWLVEATKQGKWKAKV